MSVTVLKPIVRWVVDYDLTSPISLLVTPNNYWLFAEFKLEKKIQSSTQKYRTPSELQNEVKKNIVVLTPKNCFFWRKLLKKPNLSLCFSEISKIFICVLFTVFTLGIRKREACRKHVDQTCRSNIYDFSTRSPL